MHMPTSLCIENKIGLEKGYLDDLGYLDELQSKQVSLIILEQVLCQLGQAVILVNERAEILFASTAARGILAKKDGLALVGQQLGAVYQPDNIRLQETITFVVPNLSCITPRHKTLHVHRGLSARPYLLTVVQMPKLHGFEKHHGHVAMVILRDLQANYQGLMNRMKRNFELTPRETETAILLAEGRDCKEISALLNLSLQTVRQHLKSVFRKMNVNKQHELVCLTLELTRKR